MSLYPIFQIASILLFTLGYKSDFNFSHIACSIRDFTCDNVSGFVYELSAFNKFENVFGFLDFSDPTNIIAAFGLKSNMSCHLFTESNLNYPITINIFGINILITIFDGATCPRGPASVRTGNSVNKCLGSIRPGNR